MNRTLSGGALGPAARGAALLAAAQPGRRLAERPANRLLDPPANSIAYHVTSLVERPRGSPGSQPRRTRPETGRPPQRPWRIPQGELHDARHSRGGRPV